MAISKATDWCFQDFIQSSFLQTQIEYSMHSSDGSNAMNYLVEGSTFEYAAAFGSKLTSECLNFWFTKSFPAQLQAYLKMFVYFVWQFYLIVICFADATSKWTKPSFHWFHSIYFFQFLSNCLQFNYIRWKHCVINNIKHNISDSKQFRKLCCIWVEFRIMLRSCCLAIFMPMEL